MGKNTPERQEFIIDNLYIEKDLALDEKNETPIEEEAA
jgi:topoisomerase IV subunit B